MKKRNSNIEEDRQNQMVMHYDKSILPKEKAKNKINLLHKLNN